MPRVYVDGRRIEGVKEISPFKGDVHANNNKVWAEFEGDVIDNEGCLRIENAEYKDDFKRNTDHE